MFLARIGDHGLWKAVNDAIFPQGQPLPKLEFLNKKPLITGVSQQLLCTSEP